MVEKNDDVVSDAAANAGDSNDAADSGNNTSARRLDTMPYRLTEQFVINVQKDAEPSVRFLLLCLLFLNNSMIGYFCVNKSIF